MSTIRGSKLYRYVFVMDLRGRLPITGALTLTGTTKPIHQKANFTAVLGPNNIGVYIGSKGSIMKLLYEFAQLRASNICKRGVSKPC